MKNSCCRQIFYENSAVPLEVLLATYNSGRFLRDQIDSLFAQDYQNFRILIRDGGSMDDTLDIIRQYQVEYPGRISFLGSQRAGARDNFSELLNASRAELVMFCDHDDVWFPGKISATLEKYREMEQKYGPEMPILVFTDACIADQRLRVIASSLFHYQHLDPVHLSLNRLLLQNIPNGNTMLVNRVLVDLASPVSQDAVMHDHWLSLTAVAFGKIGFMKEPTIYYRQHGGNFNGVSKYSFFGMMNKIRAGRKKIRNRFDRNIKQAAAFGRRYGTRLQSAEREMLSDLEHWDEYGFWERRKILLKHHILKSGFLRNFGMLFLV